MFVGWEGGSCKEMERKGKKESGGSAVLHDRQGGCCLYMTQRQSDIIELVDQRGKTQSFPL